MTSARELRRLAAESGFELCGAVPARPLADFPWFLDWADRGYAGKMGYLTDHRAGLRADPRQLLPSARSVICVGKLYNGPEPYSTEFDDPARAWIARYAWGSDYHGVLQSGLAGLAARLGAHEFRVCVDTAPLLERSWARLAGLGWIGKNTCLIHEGQGSWFFLGELLTSLEIESTLDLAPDRCGTCTRCIDACPTAAILPVDGRRHAIDSRLCISYLTIELRGEIDPALRPRMGPHVFGCDICQDVCPWNRRAPVTEEFSSSQVAPPLERLAALTPEQFQQLFRSTPVSRARYTGFLRNVAVAMGNSRDPRMREPLERLARSELSVVAEHARWALATIEGSK